MSKKDQEIGDNTLKQIDIPKELRPIIDDPGIPEEKRKQIAEVVLGISVGQETEFSGPIPPPELLKPGLCTRILLQEQIASISSTYEHFDTHHNDDYASVSK